MRDICVNKVKDCCPTSTHPFTIMRDQALVGDCGGVSIRCEASGGVIDIPGCEAEDGIKVVKVKCCF